MDRKSLSLLILIVLLGLCIRLQNFGEIFDSRIYYYGYDPYYHMRLVEAIVLEGYRPSFDYYINYPYGLRIDWLPLFDYILAFPGLFLGFWASEIFAVVFPVIIGVLCIVLVYLISLEVLRNEKFALISAFIFSVCPVTVWKSLLGKADHHIWVVFLLLLSIWLVTKPGLLKLLSGIPMLLMALSWLGAPIYAALLAVSSLFQFNEKEVRIVGISNLIPVLSSIQNLFLGFSFLAIAVFLLVGSFVKRFERRFRYAIVYYLCICSVALLSAYLMPVGWLGFVKSGISYVLGTDIYLPTIREARSFQILGVISSAGYLFFVLAIPALFMLRNGFLKVFFVLSFLISILQLRFVEVLAFPVAILASYTICQILERVDYPVFRKEEEGESKRRGRKEKKKAVEIRKKDHATVIAFLLFLALPCFANSLAPVEMTMDWKEALNWMKENLEAQDYLKAYEKPDYAVLSWWDYGNWILYVAKKAVVCNNFQAGADDAAKFFTAQSEEEAMKIVEKRKVRYVVTVEELTVKPETNKTKFIPIMQIAGYSPEYMKNKEIIDFFNKTMLYKLHVENATNLTHFRLLKNFGTVKIFEVK
ncbi:STT3 domain-containing protein [Archaeoglobus fulgidus]|nr:STT3 domain-containing protein [Archaeoglobus fulgidus]